MAAGSASSATTPRHPRRRTAAVDELQGAQQLPFPADPLDHTRHYTYDSA
ncbi:MULTISPECIES: hypothetical protein [Streptomyces]|nr:hypothetical protein [Streptomyces canus]